MKKGPTYNISEAEIQMEFAMAMRNPQSKPIHATEPWNHSRTGAISSL